MDILFNIGGKLLTIKYILIYIKPKHMRDVLSNFENNYQAYAVI